MDSQSKQNAGAQSGSERPPVVRIEKRTSSGRIVVTYIERSR